MRYKIPASESSIIAFTGHHSSLRLQQQPRNSNRSNQPHHTNLRVLRGTGDITDGFGTLCGILCPQTTHPCMGKPRPIIMRILGTLNQHHRPDPGRRTLIKRRISRIMRLTVIEVECTTRGRHGLFMLPSSMTSISCQPFKFSYLENDGR
jgi:hypothetical protein